MGTQSTVAKWGASRAVRIPKAIAEQWGVGEGSRIELIPRGEQVVTWCGSRFIPGRGAKWAMSWRS